MSDVQAICLTITLCWLTTFVTALSLGVYAVRKIGGNFSFGLDKTINIGTGKLRRNIS